MIKIKKWQAVAITSIFAIALALCTILTTREMRRASAASEGVQVSIYDSQTYSYSPIVYSIDGSMPPDT